MVRLRRFAPPKVSSLDSLKLAEDALVKDGLWLARKSLPLHRRLFWKSDTVEPAVRHEAQRLMKFLFVAAAALAREDNDPSAKLVLKAGRTLYPDFGEDRLVDFREAPSPGELFVQNLYS